jgi:cyclase
MVKVRLIPILLLQNGLLVRAQEFNEYKLIGNPIHEVQRFSEWNVDELIYLDITRDGGYAEGRKDQARDELMDPMSILRSVSTCCFMPLTWGGRIRTIEDMSTRFSNGADKITINTEAYLNPDLITQGANRYGSQAIVVSIDCKRDETGGLEVMIQGGSRSTGEDPADWAKRAADLGAGEILLTSIDRDGTGRGYDLDLINYVSQKVRIPVIACGGAGDYKHYVQAVEAGASAVAAANLFHFKELSDRWGKKIMSKAGIDVREIF